MTRRGDVLLDRVKANGDDASAHALLNEFFSGYPIEQLRQLLRSSSESDVRIGAWIASELGAQIRPLIDDLVQLLRHESRYVRFFTLDCILVGTGPENGLAFAAAAQLVEDPDSAVRWKAMNVLAGATSEQLAAATGHMSDPRLAELLAWLVQAARTSNVLTVCTRLADPDPLVRRVASIAAARLAPRDASALELAASSSDDEISSFAKERLQGPQETLRKGRGLRH